MKMNKIWYVIMSSLMTLFISGCNSGVNTDEPIPDPEIKKLQYTEHSEDFMWPGDEREVFILTEGAYDIKPLDNETATVEVISNTNFKVKAKKPGVTILTIIDEDLNSHAFGILVSDKLTGAREDVPSYFKFEIDVSDPATKTAIENEWGPRLALFYGATYNFNDEKKSFTIYHSELFSGTYTFDIYAKKMELIYDGYTDVFTVTTMPMSSRSLILVQDLTDYYKSIYPDKGVSKVSNTRLLTVRRSEFEH